MEKTCDNCVHKSPKMSCKPYCIDHSSHEFTCEFCKYKFPKEAKLFCEMDDGDDGMSCCGDKFELNLNYE